MRSEDFRKPANFNSPNGSGPRPWPKPKQPEPIEDSSYEEEFFGSSSSYANSSSSPPPQMGTSKPIITASYVDANGNPVGEANPNADRRYMDDNPWHTFIRQSGSWHAKIPERVPPRNPDVSIETVMGECKFLSTPAEEFEVYTVEQVNIVKEAAMKQIMSGLHCPLTKKIGLYGGWWFFDAPKIKDIFVTEHHKYCHTCKGEIMRMQDFHPNAMGAKLQKATGFGQGFVTGCFLKSIFNIARKL